MRNIGIIPNIPFFVRIFDPPFLGGFSAVCWTDFFQGLLILGGMLIAPIFAMSMIDMSQASNVASSSPDFWNAFADWKSIVSGLGWGLGYFGMPHIIIRFMSMRSQKEMKKSAIIGISWTFLILIFAVAIGIIGLMLLGYNEETSKNSTVFIVMVRKIFPGIISGILLSAVLAASMSTADSQLLSASSSFSSDLYKPVFRKNKASDKEIGAAIGPSIILSLFWKRFSFAGAIAGITVGSVVDICWLLFLSADSPTNTCLYNTGIYEIIPGFIAGLIAAVIVTLAAKKPSKDVEELYDKAVAYKD